MTPEFESRMDPMFLAHWKEKKRVRERKRFNSRMLGVGMMPPNWREERKREATMGH